MHHVHMSLLRRLAGLCISIAVPSLAACGGGDSGTNNPPPPPPPPPSPVALAQAAPSGDAQTGTVATALASPIRVAATRNGQAAAGVTVTWSTSGTGASVSPSTSVTNAQGLASTTWTLAQNAGPKNATATVTGATGSPVLFTATATAGAAATIALAGGNAQSGTVNTPLTTPLGVRVSDQYGNPVTGTSVAWTVLAGGGTMAAATTLSNSFGIASGSWTLGNAIGAQSAQAASPGLVGSPIAFAATATTPPVGVLAITVGNDFFNPGTPTIVAGTAVTWTWVGTGSVPHSVRSTGTPSFPSSVTLTGDGNSHAFTFTVPGAYEYDCAVHGALMKGTITVQ